MIVSVTVVAESSIRPLLFTGSTHIALALAISHTLKSAVDSRSCSTLRKDRVVSDESLLAEITTYSSSIEDAIG